MAFGIFVTRGRDISLGFGEKGVDEKGNNFAATEHRTFDAKDESLGGNCHHCSVIIRAEN
jgi:hypothetical protein